MFELEIALKYLIPRKRSLSTALIAALSVAVISLVVWLVLVFLSVTAGIERNWLRKLTSLHAPIRIVPTEEYYQSYYYRIDALASASNFTLKTVGEKIASLLSDPYNPDQDAEVPFYWPPAERIEQGQLLDPVKKAVHVLRQLQSSDPHIRFQDYEIGGALLKIEQVRAGRAATLSQMSFLLSFADQNPGLASLMLSPTPEEIATGKAARIEGSAVILPEGNETPIFLPKAYREGKVKIGDRGTLAYSAPTATTTSLEQSIPVFVAGFYDPGFGSMGNRCVIVPSTITRMIHSATQTFSPDGTPTNGFFVWPRSIEQADNLRNQLVVQFDREGILKYWKIDTYKEFEFSKDLLHQFQSDKTLFTLVGGIILLVACSNIISLLILLVNDKKREIAILKAIGAPFGSIAAIFGICGIAMGVIACAIGTVLAWTTLYNIDRVIALLSALQGRAALNPVFFGDALPKEFSSGALLFVCIATPLLSLLAGIAPAIKALRIQTATALRSE